MKTFAAAAFAAIATADQSDFPADAWNHAGCHMTVTFPSASCETLYVSMDTEIRSWNPEPLDTPGYYSVYEEEDDVYIWSQRLTYNQKYMDDQLFDFADNGAGCTITAKSRSETVSMLDNCVNYCNMWNVLSRIDGFQQSTCSTSDCKTTPSDPKTTCARY